MPLSKQPYKGTRDLFPPDKRTQEFLFKKMKETALLFGYEPYDGPLLEEVELYRAKSGEELIKEQIYSFVDRGERLVAIRPEMTPTLARMVAQIYKESPRPLRWYAIPNLMRYEKPQKGRLREHWQFNCDIFGAPPMQGELEILQVAINLLNSFGATENDFEVLINDRIIVDSIFKVAMQLSSETIYRLYKIIDRAKKVSPETLEFMLNELSLSSNSKEIFLAYLQLSSFDDLFTFLSAHKLDSAKEYFQTFVSKLKQLNLISYVKYDPTIVRGLDYYTGVVFEIYDRHPDNRRALCGGGTYANLLEIFNESPLPGVGFGLGDVTLKDFLSVHKLLPDFTRPDNDIFLTFQVDAAEMPILKLAQDLRKLNWRVLTTLQPLKINKCFPLATRNGAKFIGLLGEDELKKQMITIKNLVTGHQESINFNEITNWANQIERKE